MVDSILMENIKSTLQDILRKRLGKDIDLKNNDLFKSNVFGKRINFAPRDLLYLYFEITRAFSIDIPQEFVVEGRLKSFEGICCMIYELTKASERNMAM